MHRHVHRESDAEIHEERGGGKKERERTRENEREIGRSGDVEHESARERAKRER